MFIQTEATNDPASLKFLLGRPVLPHGTLDIHSREEAVRSPLAIELFRVHGVASLSFGPDYIIVTKERGDWRHMKPALLGIITDHFASGAPLVANSSADDSSSAEEDDLTARVRNALRRVIDPELGYNIVDLGLIYDVSVGAGGMVTVIMTTTTPGCPATTYLREGARECVAAVEGVETAEITLTYEPRWSPELMSGALKARFGMSRNGLR